ncbi:NADAR family protein [Amycolatopsis sp. H20-H5]|uniref:NADAR family protein n=1 Tax=Amycolatopsis sp. H20-H5 TaxID=3046309 RepID=UPI002DBD6C97|nr:NADAR family protein [Amycolatopsis sp. H20-H5]MEC3973851.1 NADAR family protein [Amycolatopsis sp. H20-H5]
MVSKVDGVRSLDALRELIHGGAEPEYLLFYGHTPSKSGIIASTCLSQWWEAEFEVNGERYLTAEHFMMASKAALFGDEEKAAEIRQAPDPKTAKILGREVAEFDAAKWESHRFDIVIDGNLAKFGQHAPLRTYLLGTENRVLVEASKKDLIWGSGIARDEKNSTKPDYWRGQNLLGFALMEVREQLRS